MAAVPEGFIDMMTDAEVFDALRLWRPGHMPFRYACAIATKVDPWEWVKTERPKNPGSILRQLTPEEVQATKDRWNRRIDYQIYLQSAWWQSRRLRALELAKHRCQLCNKDDYLQVHHKTYDRLGEEEDDDLIVLCRRCHRRHHRILAESKEPKTKWEN